MSIVTISDVHIKTNNDEGAILLDKFFSHKLVKEAEEIYFLGDIFDLMIGPHEIYYEKYNIFFDNVKRSILNGQTVFYIEGNHDFHLKKLFKNFIKLNELDSRKFIFSRKAIVKTIYEKKIFLSHGDDIELGNPNYKLYKKIITSQPLGILANYLLPYRLLNWIGETASKKSRSYNKEKYEEIPSAMLEVQKSFQQAASKVSTQYDLDYLVCGHSHVEEKYYINNTSIYLNNGYVQMSKKFIYINNEGAKLVDL